MDKYLSRDCVDSGNLLLHSVIRFILAIVIFIVLCETFKYDMIILLKWFKVISLEENPKKFYFLILREKSKPNAALIVNFEIIRKST